MIRIETRDGWILVEHREHARLAGRFAARWGNAEFAPPGPLGDVRVAVLRHDDAWAAKDATPHLAREGRPGAFSRDLVGKYSAFEEIDLADYLAVRGRAAQAVAADNPYAAVIISMHTVDLLTGQADLSACSEAEKELHRRFIEVQRREQGALVRSLAAVPRYREAVTPSRLQRAFEFLQACDSLSLAVCVRYPLTIRLRHRHPRRDGRFVALDCIPLGGDTYRVRPYPFDSEELHFRVPCRHVRGRRFADAAEFRRAYARTPPGALAVRIVK
jgi:hypothetical protein